MIAACHEHIVVGQRLSAREGKIHEYLWPPDYAADSKRAEEAWLATCISLPIESLVTGTVIGRQPFGGFLKLDGVPDAVGLAEITALPSGSDLPRLHAHVSLDLSRSSGGWLIGSAGV